MSCIFFVSYLYDYNIVNEICCFVTTFLTHLIIKRALISHLKGNC